MYIRSLGSFFTLTFSATLTIYIKLISVIHINVDYVIKKVIFSLMAWPLPPPPLNGLDINGETFFAASPSTH